MGLGSVMSAVDRNGSAAFSHGDRPVPTYMSPSRLKESVGVAAEHAISLKYCTQRTGAAARSFLKRSNRNRALEKTP